MILSAEHRGGSSNLVAGDTGISGMKIVFHDPWRNPYSVTSGTKVEHGDGGFEVVCPPGNPYSVSIASETWYFEHRAGMTFLTWQAEPEPVSVSASVSPSASTSVSPSPSPEPPSPSPQPEPPSPSPVPPVARWAELLHRLDIIIALLEQIRDT